jgi:hypothetical protein
MSSGTKAHSDFRHAIIAATIAPPSPTSNPTRSPARPASHRSWAIWLARAFNCSYDQRPASVVIAVRWAHRSATRSNRVATDPSVSEGSNAEAAPEG